MVSGCGSIGSSGGQLADPLDPDDPAGPGRPADPRRPRRTRDPGPGSGASTSVRSGQGPRMGPREGPGRTRLCPAPVRESGPARSRGTESGSMRGGRGLGGGAAGSGRSGRARAEPGRSRPRRRSSPAAGVVKAGRGGDRSAPPPRRDQHTHCGHARRPRPLQIGGRSNGGPTCTFGLKITPGDGILTDPARTSTVATAASNFSGVGGTGTTGPLTSVPKPGTVGWDFKLTECSTRRTHHDRSDPGGGERLRRRCRPGTRRGVGDGSPTTDPAPVPARSQLRPARRPPIPPVPARSQLRPARRPPIPPRTSTVAT